MLPAMPLASNRLCRGMPNGAARMFAGCSFATLLAVLGGQTRAKADTPMDKEGSLQNLSRRSLRSSWLLARRGLKLHQVALCIELGLV